MRTAGGSFPHGMNGPSSSKDRVLHASLVDIKNVYTVIIFLEFSKLLLGDITVLPTGRAYNTLRTPAGGSDPERKNY